MRALLYRTGQWLRGLIENETPAVKTHLKKNEKKIKMCDDEIAALVVDNGSGMCKAGFAGDDAPR